jgi:hypothetical protein
MFIILASVLSFVLFVTLNIMFDSVAQDPTTSGALLYLIQSPAINALNLIIIMISPAAFIVGTVGSVTMFIRSRREIT